MTMIRRVPAVLARIKVPDPASPSSLFLLEPLEKLFPVVERFGARAAVATFCGESVRRQYNEAVERVRDGKFAEALGEYNRVLAVSPKCAPAVIDLTAVLFLFGDFEGAKRFMTRIGPPLTNDPSLQAAVSWLRSVLLDHDSGHLSRSVPARVPN